jgi:YbbR domain-containing protein
MFGFLTRNLRYKALALFIAVLLWGLARGTASSEQGFDIPIVFTGLPENVVVVGQNTDDINVRFRGSRAGLGRLARAGLQYDVDVSGARPGRAIFEVDASRLDYPRGTQPVSRSPSNLVVEFERRSSRVVRVRPEVAGEPAPGHVLVGVNVEPPEVRIEGARSEVQQMRDVATETIDVTGLEKTQERPVRLSITRPHVWLAEDRPLQARIRIRPAEEAASR